MEASQVDNLILDDEKYNVRDGHGGMAFISGTR